MVGVSLPKIARLKLNFYHKSRQSKKARLFSIRSPPNSPSGKFIKLFLQYLTQGIHKQKIALYVLNWDNTSADRKLDICMICC